MTRFHPADVAQHLRAASIRWLRVMDEAQYVQRAVEANAGGVSFDDAEKQLHRLQMRRDDALSALPSAERRCQDARERPDDGNEPASPKRL